MSFLNLSTIQAIFLALLTLGVVLALFFLKLRHRRVVVGSALLWKRVLHDQQSNSLMERLRRILSLMLAITIALLIAMAAGRPYFSTSGSGLYPVVIVLDASESMAAITNSGRTRWETAVEEAQRVLGANSGPGGVMTADTAGRVQTPITNDQSEILSAIHRMRPFTSSGRFPELPSQDAVVYFITDGVTPPPDIPNGTNLISVFETADNVGITSFEIRVDPTSPSGYTAYLEVTNFSNNPKEVAIVVAGVGRQRVVRGADINPNEVWKESLDLEGFEGGGIQARIQTDGDRFATDNEAFGYMPARGTLNVTLVTPELNSYLETLLRLTPEVTLAVTTPNAFQESVSTDIYIFEGAAPLEAPRKPSLLFGPPAATWLPSIIGLVTDPRISSWDDEHPVMRFVPVYDLGISEATVVDPGSHNVVAASGQTPLILVHDTDGANTVIVTFGLNDSDFAFHLGFPIFVENVLSYFSGETLAETSPLGEVELPARTSNVTRLDGTSMEMFIRSGRTVVELNEPDLLTVIADGRRIRVAANMTDPERSEINDTLFTAAQGDSVSLPRAGNELWIYMLIGATLLIALEWWTYHKRITL